MTGEEHYKRAENLLAQADQTPDYDGRIELLDAAQVHATLAVAWATATK
jgi:hypothetical protein